MRNIYAILIFIAPLLFVCGCSNDEYTEPVPEITVIKSEVWFDCNSNSGSIEFISDQTVTYSCDADWCSVSLEKNVIKVDVKSNDDIQGRITYISLKTPSGFETFVAVKQDGVVLGSEDQTLYLSINKGGTVNTEIKFTTTVDIEQTGDWFNYIFENGTLAITAEPSNSARKGYLTLKSGTKELKVFISQSQLSYEEFLGTWTMKYTSRGGGYIERNITLVENEKNAIFDIKGAIDIVDVSIPIRYNEKTGVIYFLSTDPVKIDRDLKCYVYGWNGASGLFTSASHLYTGRLNFESSSIEYVFNSNNASYPGIGIFSVSATGYGIISNQLCFANLIMMKQ